eukprot:11510363-Alexandrium_andersonii.AAC.1
MSFPGYKQGLVDGASVETLSLDDASQYRALAAGANILSLDRPFLSFAAKGCCRRVSFPTEGDWA